MQIKVKGTAKGSHLIASKAVKGWDIDLNINVYKNGKVMFKVWSNDWTCKHPKAFTEGGTEFPTLEQAVEYYNEFK